jgi:bacillithiol biosynthesis cysteine-adding enzyme BshC
MNRETVSAFPKNSLKLETISFSLIPGQSKLFLDFQANSTKVGKFYPEKQTSLKDFAKKVLSEYKIDRDELCDVLAGINKSFDAGAKTFENIEFLRQNDCLAVVTGQQAGLFSGALYTIYKALSAIRLCENLRAQNIKAVPIFWIAEEDHDFDEIKKTFVIDKEAKLAEIENQPKERRENLPVGLIKLDETVSETIDNLFSGFNHTEFTGDLKKYLVEAYKTDETFSAAFAKFLAKVFSEYGIIYLSPLDKKLKKLCSPIFRHVVENSEKIISALLQRNVELKKEEYSPQVLVEESSFPFFYLNENDERIALRQDLQNKKIKAQKSKANFDLFELENIAEKSPEKLSPNALLRPVIQDYLLPTLTYFGGAAEIAYFAQNSVIYEILNRPVTPIRHRASLTIIEPKNRRTLEKYELKFTDLFKGKEKISTEVVEKFLNNDTAKEFAEVEEVINTQLNRLDQNLLRSEPTLADNLANRRRKILWHIGALRKKYHRAEIFKNKVAGRRIENIFSQVLPHNSLQERTLNVVTFLNIYGENFINWVYNRIETEEKNHQILYL